MYVLIEQGDCFKVPCQIVDFVSSLISAIKVFAVILIIIFGMLDFFKGVFTKNENDVEKNKRMFVKRLISVSLVFLVVYVVQFVGNVLETSNDSKVMSCVSYMVKGDNKNLYCK